MNKWVWLFLVVFLLLAGYLFLSPESESPQPQILEREQPLYDREAAPKKFHDIQAPAMPEEGGIGGSGHTDCQDTDENCKDKLP